MAYSGTPIQFGETVISGITGANPAIVLTAAQAMNYITILQPSGAAPTGMAVITYPNGISTYIVANGLPIPLQVKTVGGAGSPGNLNAGDVKQFFVDAANNVNTVI